MTKKDVSQHIKPSRIKKANASVRQLLDILRKMANPFEMTGESPLFNIATGKSVMLKIENFHLNIDIIGNTERNKLIDECTEGPTRFEVRIKKQKLSTFTTKAGKEKNYIKRWEDCFVQDILGSLLELIIKKRTDIREVLTYPLTSVCATFIMSCWWEFIAFPQGSIIKR